MSKLEQKGSCAQKIRSFYSGVSKEWHRMACTAQYLQVLGGNFLAAEPIDLVQVQRSSSYYAFFVRFFKALILSMISIHQCNKTAASRLRHWLSWCLALLEFRTIPKKKVWPWNAGHFNFDDCRFAKVFGILNQRGLYLFFAIFSKVHLRFPIQTQLGASEKHCFVGEVLRPNCTCETIRNPCRRWW